MSFTLKKKMVALFAVFLSAVLGLSLFFFYRMVRSGLEEENLVRMAEYGKRLERAFDSGGVEGLREGLSEIEAGAGERQARVTLIAEDGTVLYDSSGTVSDNHRSRPEILEAGREGTGSAVRYSNTLRTHMHYYAFRVQALGGGYTFIRVAWPLAALTRILSALMWRSLFCLLVVGGVSLLFWMWLTKRIFRPLEKIIHRSEHIGGTTNVRFPLFREVEFRKLSMALNDMSTRLQEANANIQARREELTRIVEALPVGVVLTDPARDVRYLNSVARGFFGDRGEVVKGSPVERLISNGEIYDMLGGPDSCRTVFLPPVAALPSDRGRNVEACTITLANGRLMMLRDVTTERTLEETRRNFTIDAGHELQTPLTAIRAAAELLLDGRDPDSEDGRLIGTILRQQQRMTSLIDDLLLLIRLEDGPRPEEHVREDLAEVLSSLAEEYREHPATGRIGIETDLPQEAPVDAARPELLRALSNLVDNAVRKVTEKYDDAPGGKISISLKREDLPARTEGTADNPAPPPPGGGIGSQGLRPWWKVLIADNGPGVSPEVEDRIFRSFHSASAARRGGKWGSGGHGLGLSIAARIVEAHGGTVDLLPLSKSPLGGAAFEIRLPGAEEQSKGL